MKKLLSIFFCFSIIMLLVTGCATIQLTPNGEKVQILTYVPSDLENYVEVGTFKDSQGFNARSPNENIISCRNKIRNDAAAAGATIVIIEHQETGTELCPNCITVIGRGYKKK